ncbi:hypothetical protein Tco_0670593 [Tanacetum coccineum]
MLYLENTWRSAMETDSEEACYMWFPYDQVCACGGLLGDQYLLSAHPSHIHKVEKLTYGMAATTIFYSWLMMIPVTMI